MANYYLVKGSNAVAVVQSWSHALRIQKYFKGFNSKGYDTYDAANEAGLEHLAEIAPSYLPLPEHLTLGRCPFGISWRSNDRSGYKIPTLAFFSWLTKGTVPVEL